MKPTITFSSLGTLWLLAGFYSFSLADLPTHIPTFDLPLSTCYQPISAEQSCPVWVANCIGQKKYEDGSVYGGEFKFGKPHGEGVMTWKDGSQYQGSFKNGERHGQGIYSFQNGNHYQGEWALGYMEGEGAYTWACGHEYIGTFKQGKMEGEGAILMDSGESYSGTWKAGTADGFGSFQRIDGSRFVGECKNGLKDGQGEIIFRSGDTLRGNWIAGNLDGNIIFKFKTGDQMISSWDNGDMLEGVVYHTSEGQHYLGTYQEIINDLNAEAFDKVASFEENMQIGLYSFGVEFKTMNRFEEATALFQQSREISHHNMPLLSLINVQIEEIKTQQSDSGWAKIDDNIN